MKYTITLLVYLHLSFTAASQNVEVEGKMTVRDINTIATFQSTAKNSFIRFATNDDPLRSTNIGYFDNEGQVLPQDLRKYFFIDTPEGDFGEFVIDSENGFVGIGTLSPSRKLHVRSDFGDVRMGVNNFNPAVLEVRAYGSNNQLLSVQQGLGTAITGASYEGYGLAGVSSQSYGVYGHGGDFANEAQPDFWAENGNYGGTSSRRWKNNIINIPQPLDKISKLHGVYFDWDKEHGGKHGIGFIAEEVGEILPEVVFYEQNGIDAKGMDYSKMTALLVEAANAMRKEYQNKFEQQESKIAYLEHEMAEIKSLLKRQTAH